MYSTYIQRIEIALLSDPWCIQLTLNTDSRRTNTDKYSLNICTYKLYRYTNEDIVEKKEIDKVAISLLMKGNISHILHFCMGKNKKKSLKKRLEI